MRVIRPERFARLDIERMYDAMGAASDELVADLDGSVLVRVRHTGIRAIPRMKGPCDLQLIDILLVDLGKRRKAPAFVGPAVSRPVPRVDRRSSSRNRGTRFAVDRTMR